MGARARILTDRRGRGGSRRRRGRPARLARGGLPRQHGLHGGARHEARASRRAASGRAARHHGAHGLPARVARRRLAAGRGDGAPGAARRGGDLDVCPRPRLSQGAAQPPAEAGRSPGRRDRPAGPSLLHRFGAGDGGGTRHALGPGLARQAHADARARRRLDVLPRRDLRRHRAAADRRRRAALRPLHGLHGRLPDAGDRRARAPRRAPLHLLPDHRERRSDPARVPPRDRQPHLRLRRLPGRVPVEQVRAAQSFT